MKYATAYLALAHSMKPRSCHLHRRGTRATPVAPPCSSERQAPRGPVACSSERPAPRRTAEACARESSLVPLTAFRRLSLPIFPAARAGELRRTRSGCEARVLGEGKAQTWVASVGVGSVGLAGRQRLQPTGLAGVYHRLVPERGEGRAVRPPCVPVARHFLSQQPHLSAHRRLPPARQRAGARDSAVRTVRGGEARRGAVWGGAGRGGAGGACCSLSVRITKRACPAPSTGQCPAAAGGRGATRGWA